jgi:ribonuclease BN (tRNA processing enzyme)
MKLTVIGKYGPYAKSGNHAASCYLVSGKNTNLVLEMGPGSMSRLTDKIDIEDITAIFISHLQELDRKVKIYSIEQDTPWFHILFDHPLIEHIPVKSGESVNAGEFRLSFYEMKHTEACLAVRIEGEKTLVYTGDTVYNDNIFQAVRGADLLLSDTSKPLGFKGPHMNIGNAREFNEKTGIRVISTHLSPGYDPAPEFENYPGIEVAEEGKTYEI